MKIIPDWWSSIRSLVTLILALGFVYQGCIIKEIDPVYTTVFMATIAYYFKDKLRNGDQHNEEK